MLRAYEYISGYGYGIRVTTKKRKSLEFLEQVLILRNRNLMGSMALMDTLG